MLNNVQHQISELQFVLFMWAEKITINHVLYYLLVKTYEFTSATICYVQMKT